MLSKKSRPMIGILTGSFLSGNKSGPVDLATSPRTHSPNGPRKSFEISGIGLGIVAALDNPVDTRSNPIPVKRNKAYGRGGDTCPFRIQTSLFKISPEAAGPELPEADFLSSCHLCRKNLHGEDIYMYRGEKAFCSTECRYREMAMEDRREKCGSAVDVSSAPRANGSILAI